MIAVQWFWALIIWFIAWLIVYVFCLYYPINLVNDFYLKLNFRQLECEGNSSKDDRYRTHEVSPQCAPQIQDQLQRRLLAFFVFFLFFSSWLALYLCGVCDEYRYWSSTKEEGSCCICLRGLNLWREQLILLGIFIVLDNEWILRKPF